MHIEYNRNACSGWFQCVQKWDAFEMNVSAEKADLEDAEERDNGVFVREIPENRESEAMSAAETCPVNAIIVFDEDGNQISP